MNIELHVQAPQGRATLGFILKNYNAMNIGLGAQSLQGKAT